MSATLTLRGRVAALSRTRSKDDPELIEARRQLAAETIAQYAQRVAAAAPPLSPEQKARIAAALAPRNGGGAR